MTVWALAAVLPLLAGEEQEKELFHISGPKGFGTAVCILGDVDGDGVQDIAVGRPDPWERSVAVHSGADGKKLWQTDGEEYQPELGRSLAAVGDLNADGCPDLLAAYPTDWGAVDDFNRAWVLSGTDGTKLLEILGNEITLDGFASAVAPAGDLDGDGIPDMWIGAEFGPREPRLGRVAVFSGRDGHEIRHVDSPTVKLFGRAMCAMGDLDGDGIGDLAVGDGHHEAGLTLISGASAKVLCHVRVERASGFFTTLDRIDDLDGDGRPDVLVGSHYFPSRELLLREQGVGLAMIVSSASGDVLFRWEGGLDGRPLFGHVVVALPDLDDDGGPEFALGGSDAAGLGAVFVISAKSGKVLSCLEGTRDRGFGSALASGDLDGNGSTELVVGEPGDPRKVDGGGSVHAFTLNRH